MRLTLLLLAASTVFAQNIQTLTAQIQRTPTAALFVERGSAYLESGDAKQAIADFDRALERESVNAVALRLRAKAHAQLGNQQNAITDLSGAIALAPGDAELFLARASAYVAVGDTRRSVEDREEALRLSPEVYHAWTEAAAAPVGPNPDPVKPKPAAEPKPAPVQAAQTKPVEVRAVASNASADVHYQRARELFNQGQPKDGLTEINQAIQMSPQNPVFYNTRGYGHYLSKNYKASIADFQEALRLDPDYLNAQHNLALAYRNSRDQAGYEKARQRELDLGKKLGVKVQ